jgi:hypothetical protein
MSNQPSIDELVLDFFLRGTETVVQDRKANVQPLSNNFSSTDCSEYIRQSVQNWKRQLSRPMNVDLYIFNSVTNSHVLMERWNFSYTYTHTHDSSEINSTTNVSHHLQVLMRTLYSFLRLLPGFNLLHCCQGKPLLTLQIYDPKISPESFHYESSNYSFPTISTLKGTLSTSVRFTSPGVIKDILTAINGGPLIGLPSSSTSKAERSDGKHHSASIPIPGRGSQVDPYRTRVLSDSSREISRRSFKDDGSLLTALRNEHAQAKSIDNRNIDFAAGVASSVSSSGPSKSGGGGLVYPMSIGGSGDVPYGSSPSSYSGRLLTGHSQASSLPNNMSLVPSTPLAFASLVPGAEVGPSASLDFPRASPPFHQISASLSSNSPHMGPSQLTILMERRYSWKKNGNPTQLNQLSTSLRTEALLYAVEQELSKMKVALPLSPFLAFTQESQAIETDDNSGKSDSDTTALDGHVASHVVAIPDITLMQTTAALHGDANSEVENMTQSVSKLASYDNSSNRLDIVARYEKERERRISEIYLNDSNPNSRTVSISETTRDRDDDALDVAQIDDDTPFATFRPSFSSAVASTPLTPGYLPSTSSSAVVAPVLMILSRNAGNSGSMGGKGAGLGGTVDGLGNSGVPLPILVHDLQRTAQDNKMFLNQYLAAKGLSLPPVTPSAPSSRGVSTRF